MNNHKPEFEMELCPKRLWVLTTLSDDESVDGADSLPQGLAFHLSRCPSCRDLADQLQHVTGQLGSLSMVEPADMLIERAELRVNAALQNGAALTGRVHIVDDEREAVVIQTHRPTWSVRRFAAAAVIFVAVGLTTMWGLSPSVNFTNSRNVVSQPEISADTVLVISPTENTEAREGLSANPHEVLAAQEKPTKVNRFRSYEEAALSEERTGATAAVVLPDRAERGVGWLSWFDKGAKKESTNSTQNDNSR